MTKTITIDISTCRGIITRTGLTASSGAESLLKNELNQGLSILIPRIQGVPPSGTRVLRDKITTSRSAALNLLAQFGFDRYDPVRSPGVPIWPQLPFTALKAGRREQDPIEIDARLTKLVDGAFWFVGELDTLERQLRGDPTGIWAPNNALQGIVSTRDFFFDLFPTYQHIFNRPPARSKTESKARAIKRQGPTVRFIEAVLEAIKKNLVSAGLETVAEDDSLRPGPNTIEGWIRNYCSRKAKTD